MPSQSVKSSFITNIDYKADVLTLTFKNGDRFRYFGVPMKISIAMGNAASKGTYYVTHVKKKYFAKKLEKNQA